MNLIFLLIGLSLLVFGAELIIRGSISFGKKLKVSLFTSANIGIPPSIEIASALDANVKDEKQRTPLMWLASDYSSSKHRDGTQYQYISGKMVSICHMLIDAGADPYATDFYGMTALHWACESGHGGIVQLLLEKKMHL